MPDSSISLETRIVDLPNLGFSRLGLLTARKLASGIAAISTGRDTNQVTVEDLLHYLPMRYEDRSKLTMIRDLSEGMEASLELFVKLSGGKQVGGWRRSFRQRLYKFEISATDRDRTGKDVVIWTFLSGLSAAKIIDSYEKKFTRGVRFIAFGKWEMDAKYQTYALRLTRPDEIEVLPPIAEHLPGGQLNEVVDEPPEAIHAGRRVPVYRRINDIRPKQLREIIHELLKEISQSEVAETLPADLCKRQRLLNRAAALKQIHFPEDDSSLVDYENARSPAHRRLIFEELFWLALGLSVKRGRRIKEKGQAIQIDDTIKRHIASVLPFKLTEAQRRVVKEIFRDLKSAAPMNRLLQGDVGSGKTIVAVISMLAAMENNCQAALMVPTEILAEQHARNIKRILAASPFRIELLTGSIKSSEKKRLREAIASGAVNAVIGTHAVIQDNVAFKHLGLAVIDEQHRFGVMQRAELRARGVNPDVLVMTATPIPRSLAMTVYGDLDVSIIDQMPPGRTPIVTKMFADNADDRKAVKQLLHDEMMAGRQVYVVYPLVEESEKMDLRDATRRYEYLRDKVFPRFSVGLLHGRMKAEEKDDVMRRFVSGEIQILVSTTVIEVGVDVPNASVMVIEHAERFGLSQLHQLRGRVGRGAKQSYCVLLASDKQTDVARERLGIMEETNDGFKIAEKDLELRGPGEIMGTRQAGLPEFRVANLVRDLDILQAARKEAEHYFNQADKSAEAAQMLKRVQNDARMKLAAVG
jgi:ATP-dependent DNA helicase RecG